MNEAELYERYHAIAKTAISQSVLAELRQLIMVPEDLLLGTILARIDHLEKESQ